MGWLASQGWVLYTTGQADCIGYNYLTGPSIYNGNITKFGQAVCNGYNYLTGLSIYNGNITKFGQAVYNGVIHQMYWASQSVNNWFLNSSAGPSKMV